MKEKLRTMIAKGKEKIVYGILLLQMYLLASPIEALATAEKKGNTTPNGNLKGTGTGTGGNLKDTKLVQGTLNLGNDATVVLLLIEAVIVVVLLVAEGVKWQSAADEDKAKHKKNMKTIAGTGILIVSLTSLVPVVLSYYQ